MRRAIALVITTLVLALAVTNLHAEKEDQETVFWESIRDSKSPDDFQAYLDQFPKGTFAGLARARLKALKPKEPSSQTNTVEPAPDTHNSVAKPEANPPTISGTTTSVAPQEKEETKSTGGTEDKSIIGLLRKARGSSRSASGCPPSGTRLTLSSGETIIFNIPGSDFLCNARMTTDGQNWGYQEIFALPYLYGWNEKVSITDDEKAKYKECLRLWPLSVGKYCSFDTRQTYNNIAMHTSWKCRVESYIYITIVSNVFAVYKIRCDTENGATGFTRGQPYTATHTFYYSEDLGFPIKMDYEQLFGTPTHFKSWEVTDIVPPP